MIEERDDDETAVNIEHLQHPVHGQSAVLGHVQQTAGGCLERAQRTPDDATKRQLNLSQRFLISDISFSLLDSKAHCLLVLYSNIPTETLSSHLR